MIKEINLRNVLLEVNSEGYPTVKIGNVLDYGYKVIDDILVEALGDVKELANITILVDTKKANDVSINTVDSYKEA